MRLAQHKGRPFASRPLPGPNPAFNSKSGYLVDERRFQFQLQQNAGEDSARTVVHGDSVVVAIIEQSLSASNSVRKYSERVIPPYASAPVVTAEPSSYEIRYAIVVSAMLNRMSGFPDRCP
jgi:hypothetical protein